MQTVKELIEELQKYPEDLLVLGVAGHDNGGFICPVEVKRAMGVYSMCAGAPEFEFEMPMVHIMMDSRHKGQHHD